MVEPSAIERLMHLAKAALADHDNPEQQVDAIAAYCENFAEIDAAAGLAVEGEEEQIALEELAKKHEKVLERAACVLESTSKDMQYFKKRAHGIMAYVDTMPRKMSVTKPKKG